MPYSDSYRDNIDNIVKKMYKTGISYRTLKVGKEPQLKLVNDVCQRIDYGQLVSIGVWTRLPKHLKEKIDNKVFPTDNAKRIYEQLNLIGNIFRNQYKKVWSRFIDIRINSPNNLRFGRPKIYQITNFIFRRI